MKSIQLSPNKLLAQSAAVVAGLILSTLPFRAPAEEVPKSPKNVITSETCKPGKPGCPIPQCPPDCLMEIELSFIDASGKTQTSRGDVKTTQRQIARYIADSGLDPREKAHATKTMQAMVAAAGRGDSAKKKPEVTINC